MLMPLRASNVYARGIFKPDKAVCYAATSGFSLVAEVYQRKEIFGIANAHGSNTYAEDFFSPVHTCLITAQ